MALTLGCVAGASNVPISRATERFSGIWSLPFVRPAIWMRAYMPLSSTSNGLPAAIGAANAAHSMETSACALDEQHTEGILELERIDPL